MDEKKPWVPYPRPFPSTDPFKASLMLYILLLARCGVGSTTLHDTSKTL